MPVQKGGKRKKKKRKPVQKLFTENWCKFLHRNERLLSVLEESSLCTTCFFFVCDKVTFG